jgi:hypothetical protein
MTYPFPSTRAQPQSRRPEAARNQRAASAYGPGSRPSTRTAESLTHTLRALFAALAAALAIACAGAGNAAREAGPASLRRVESVEKAQADTPAPARLLLRAGGRLLDGPPRRAGTPPRMASSSDPQNGWFAARSILQRAAGARTRRMLTLALARRLAAARDGTLSARSTGVPPPPSA